MQLIEFDKLINGLSDESYKNVRELISQYLAFYYCDSSDVSREMLIEKIGEYLCHFEYIHGYKDEELMKVYVDKLQYILNKVVYIPKKQEKINRAYSYLKRVQDIRSNITESDDVLNDLLDLTKVFLCIYTAYLKDIKHKVGDISFSTPLVQEVNNIIKALNNKDIQTLGFLGLNFYHQKNKRRRKDNIKEPIHDVIENNTAEDNFGVMKYVSIVLIILYHNLIDQEGEASKNYD